MEYIIFLCFLILILRGWREYFKASKIKRNDIQYLSPYNGYHLIGEEFIHCDKCGKMKNHLVFSNHLQDVSNNQDFIESQYFVCCDCNKS